MKQVLKVIAIFCLTTTAIRSQSVPDFVLYDSEGKTHQLSSYLQNGQYLVLEFFHSLSTQANAMAYDLEQLYEAWGNGDFKVQFLAISLRDFDNDATLQKFKIKYRVSYPHCGVEGGALSEMAGWTDGQYGQIRLLPSFVIISPDSTVVFDIRDNNNATILDSIDHTLYRLGARKPFIVKGQVTMDESPMQEVKVEADNSDSQTNRVVLTNLEGKYIHVFDSMPSDRSILFRPLKNDRHDNGVSTWDIVFTIKHILGQESFTNIEELIAADVNHDNRISAIDVVEMRKLVLGIDTVFKNNTSWRFIPKNHQYPSVDSLFQIGFPEAITIGEILDKPDNANFIGIKIGDVNGSAEVNLLDNLEPRNSAPIDYHLATNANGQPVLRLQIPKQSLDWEGIQLGIELDATPLFVQSNLTNWDESFQVYDPRSGEWRLSYPYSPTSDQGAAYIELTLNAPLESIRPANRFKSEIYTSDLQALDVHLRPANASLQIQIYPNPASDQVHVELPSGWQQGVIQVIDVQGKAWISQQLDLDEKPFSMSLGQLPSGLYIVNCVDLKGHFASIKVLKD